VNLVRKIAMLVLLLAMASMEVGTAQSGPNIKITAKRFGFTPDQITVKKGQPVTLQLRSLDVTHGLAIEELGIKVDIPKGRETQVSFTPEMAGTFEGKCSHFCGKGHGSMKFAVVVVE
jgi:cytochrome c oxidase subunit II